MGSPRRPQTPWIAAAGAFVVALDSLVNIGLPAMAAAFEAPPEAMRWVIVGYVLTYAVTSGGLAFLARTLGIVAGVLTLAQIFATRRLVVGFEPAFVEAFRAAALGVALGAVIAMIAPDRASPPPAP